MKTFLLIFFLSSSTFAFVCFNDVFSQKNDEIIQHTTTQDILAATNHNWSNE